METTIKDVITEIVSADLDGKPFQTHILLCLQILREKEGEMSTFTDSVCFDAVNACNSSGGQERIQFILLNALVIESESFLQNGGSIETPTASMENLTKCLCLLNLRASLESGGDDMNQRALTFLSNPIGENQKLGTALVYSFLSTARLPNTVENYGLYIPALILALNIFAMAPPVVVKTAEIWNSDFEDPRTAFRSDVVDLFGRRLFALGGSAKPASAVHVDLARSIVITLTKEEFNASIVGPMKFNLMSAPHDAMETLGSFINILAETNKGEFLSPHLTTGSNLIAASLKQLINSEETKVRDDASFVLATLVKACPTKATNSVSETLISSLSSNNLNNDVNSNVTISRILLGFERLSQTLLKIKEDWKEGNFWETSANNIISALEKVERSDINTALSSWYSLLGKEMEEDDGKASSSAFSSDLLGDFNLSRSSSESPTGSTYKPTLDHDMKIKRASASSCPATKPGVQNIKNNGTLSALDRRIAAKTNAGSAISDIESQIAAKSRAKSSTDKGRFAPNSSGSDTISDLDQRINRKSLQTFVSPNEVQNKQLFISQDSNTQPPLEVKETSLGQMCSSADIEEHSLLDHDKQAKDGMDKTEYSSDECTNDLAVAVAVDPEDDPFLTTAMEYDPDAKPKIYKSKRFQYATLISIIILVAISVGIGVSLSKNISDTQEKPLVQVDEYLTKSPTFSPSFAPSTRERGLLKQLFESLYNESDYHEPALNWLLDDETSHNLIQSIGHDKLFTNNDFIRRFTVVHLYFSLSRQESGMTSCKPYKENMVLKEGENETHCIYNNHLYQDEKYALKIRARWLSDADVCDWGGIQCCDFSLGNHFEKPTVCSINFRSQELNGIIPKELGLLTELRVLNLSNNSLTGKIPKEIGNLTQIEVIEVQANKLSGPMPMQIYDLNNLKMLNVVSNKLTGQLHPNIARLLTLSGLQLQMNLFSGIIPTEIGALTNLNELSLGFNNISGTIPSELGKLKLLKVLNIRGNPLTASIPGEIGNLQKLEFFDMKDCQISGTIPDKFYNLTRLRTFLADNNQLGGSISPKIGQLKSLKVFSLRMNQMNGTIPIEVGLLSNLQLVALNRNEFMGKISEQICALTSDGQLQALMADCMGHSGSSDVTAEVKCTCCTVCCEPGIEGHCHNV